MKNCFWTHDADFFCPKLVGLCLKWPNVDQISQKSISFGRKTRPTVPVSAEITQKLAE
jgi:hypothetical protein